MQPFASHEACLWIRDKGAEQTGEFWWRQLPGMDMQGPRWVLHQGSAEHHKWEVEDGKMVAALTHLQWLDAAVEAGVIVWYSCTTYTIGRWSCDLMVSDYGDPIAFDTPDALIAAIMGATA